MYKYSKSDCNRVESPRMTVKFYFSGDYVAHRWLERKETIPFGRLKILSDIFTDDDL